MNATEQRAALVAEAYSWLRTPYHNLANVKGVGVDCAMLLVEVYRVPRGPLALEFDPRPYPPDWHLHQSEERYLAGLEVYAHRVEDSAAQPGDVALYRFGRLAAHGGIIVSDQYIIHANARSRNVELHERRALVRALDSCWSVFP